MARVILTLQYDLGEYSEEDLREMSPKAWEETFFQSDVMIGDMDIVSVKYVQGGGQCQQ